ncbi:hypothetical protein CR513_24811, partial [Mucuna pruriens]
MCNRPLSWISVRTPALSVSVLDVPLHIGGDSIIESVRTQSILLIGRGSTNSPRRVKDFDPAPRQFPLHILIEWRVYTTIPFLNHIFPLLLPLFLILRALFIKEELHCMLESRSSRGSASLYGVSLALSYSFLMPVILRWMDKVEITHVLTKINGNAYTLDMPQTYEDSHTFFGALIEELKDVFPKEVPLGLPPLKDLTLRATLLKRVAYRTNDKLVLVVSTRIK